MTAETTAGPRRGGLRSLVLPAVAAGVLCGPGPALASGPDSAATDPRGRLAWTRQIVREDAGRFLSARTAAILAAGAGLTAVSLAVEDPEATARRLSGAGWEGIADVGNFGGHPAFLGAGALALAAAGEGLGKPRMRAAGIEACRALVYTYAWVGGMKVAIPRRRPDGGRHSFPSAHTAGAFAIAPVLARRFGPAAALPAYALAVAAGIGRLHARHHHLSDVVFGAALGTSVGWAVARPDSPRAGVTLSVSPERAGFALRF